MSITSGSPGGSTGEINLKNSLNSLTTLRLNLSGHRAIGDTFVAFSFRPVAIVYADVPRAAVAEDLRQTHKIPARRTYH
jgi:hypothetical protein